MITDAAASGYIVNLPLCLIQPTASGVVMKNEPSQRALRIPPQRALRIPPQRALGIPSQ